MKQVLWINSCMRGAGQSRTLELCRTFLEELRVRRPGLKVAERDLTRAELPVMTAELSRRWEELAAEGREDPLLLPAREMARADLVVVGAPYWDLGFPAALKVYLEWACTLGITFGYTQAGEQRGLCRAERLIYITTAGGPLEDRNFGYEYVRGVAGMLGIINTHWSGFSSAAVPPPTSICSWRTSRATGRPRSGRPGWPQRFKKTQPPVRWRLCFLL